MSATHYFIGIFANISQQQPLPKLPDEAYKIQIPFTSDKAVKWHIIENIDYNRIANTLEAPVAANALVVHYGGHSNPDAMAMADGEFPMLNMLNQIGVDYAKLKLVFLNSCQALEQADALLEKGVKMVIASPNNVGDETAALFAEHFYIAIANRFSVKTAYQKALQAVCDKNGLKLEQKMTQRSLQVSKRHGYQPTPVTWWTLCYKEEAAILESLNNWLPKDTHDEKENELQTNNPIMPDNKTIIQNADKIYNIGHIDNADFS